MHRHKWYEAAVSIYTTKIALKGTASIYGMNNEFLVFEKFINCFNRYQLQC